MQLRSKSRLMAWKLEPLETWDRTKPRASELFYKGVKVAQVLPFRVDFAEFRGWYWVAEYPGSDGILCIPKMDTVTTPSEDLKGLRQSCDTYVRKCLIKPKHGCRRRLSWVKDTPDSNRSTVLSPPCGGKFLLNEKVIVGEIRPFRVRFGEYKGWYWTANLPKLEEFSHLGVTPKSTKDSPVDTLAEAKSACDGYLRGQLLISPLKKRVRPPRKKKSNGLPTPLRK